MKTILLTLISLFFAGFCVAESYSKKNLTVGLIGTENHGSALHIQISPNESKCKYSGIYFREEQEHAEVLSVALAAKMSGKLVRIDYTQEVEEGFCVGRSIYIH